MNTNSLPYVKLGRTHLNLSNWEQKGRNSYRPGLASGNISGRLNSVSTLTFPMDLWHPYVFFFKNLFKTKNTYSLYIIMILIGGRSCVSLSCFLYKNWVLIDIHTFLLTSFPITEMYWYSANLNWFWSHALILPCCCQYLISQLVISVSWNCDHHLFYGTLVFAEALSHWPEVSLFVFDMCNLGLCETFLTIKTLERTSLVYLGSALDGSVQTSVIHSLNILPPSLKYRQACKWHGFFLSNW